MSLSQDRADFRLLSGFAGLSLIAVICGIVTMVMTGTPAARWLPNAAAWAIGAIAALAIARMMPSPRIWTAIVVATLALLAVTLVGPGQQGVHRWLAIGRVQVNIAALSLPCAIVAMARLGPLHRVVPVAAAAMAAILAIQPDASQTIALALAGFAIMLTDRRVSALVTALCLLGLGALTLHRPDPLEPVAETEQIIQLAAAAHPALAWVAIASLAAIPLMLLARRIGDTATRALALYIACISAAPMFGWFPVPLAGAGMSFPLGLWLGMGLLAASHHGHRTGDRELGPQ